MIKIIKYIVLILFVFAQLITFSQQSSDTDSNIEKNETRVDTENDSVFTELTNLLLQATQENDTSLQLVLLERKCRHYYYLSQIDSLIKTAEELKQLAMHTNDTYALAMSNVYISEAYSINLLYDKAINFLDIAYDNLEKDKSNEKRIFIAKSNVLNSFANIYLNMGKPEEAIKKLKQEVNNTKELKEISEIVTYQYINFSNIATAYTLLNYDSAEYYAFKSIDLKPAKLDDEKIMISNYLVLGKVYKERELFSKALNYYNMAMQIGGNAGDNLNLVEFYSDLVDLYETMGRQDSAIIYDNKLKELEISSLQRKYNSLQMIINKTDDSNLQERSYLLLYISIFLVLLGFFIFFFMFRKKRFTKKDTSSPELYNSLIGLIKNNDPAFMFTFEKVYPNFSSYLLKINPQLSKSEIEFCALLKLNLSSKEIANYKFIEPRTVQNKKYRLRKRLNIPSSIDIYIWFSPIE